MGTWWIGSADPKNYGQIDRALTTMKLANTIECDDAGKEAFIAYLKERNRWSDECGAHATPEIFFDGGGSISVSEPSIFWVSNGAGMKTYTRHLPFVLEAFRGLKPDQRLPGMRRFGGFCRIYIISEPTIQAAMVDLERLVRENEATRQELERETQDRYDGMKHNFSMRKCGCLSGNTYVECCGKGKETK